jgi:hypothetical protein
VTKRRFSAFVDALVAGRRPGRFRADADDVDALRAAIALRAERPGDAALDERFVERLYEELADEASARGRRDARSIGVPRGRAALVAVAAALVLVAGTATATEVVDRPSVAPVAVPAPHGQILRTGTFEGPGHRAMGQIVAYDGHPSWVFMNVEVARYDGRIICMLQSDNGSTVAAGAFDLSRGAGEFSRTVQVDVGRLRGARLVTTTGSVVATALFA